VTCRPQERCHSNCQPRRRQTRILRELIARDIRECARYGRRIDGETAKLEIQTDRANVEGRRDLIVDDVTSNWPVLTLRSTKSDAPAACNIRDAPQD